MNEYLIKFNEPYNFEGEEYQEIDLSGLNNLKTKDLAEAEKVFISDGNVAVVNEMSVGYACVVASKATKLPMEFFGQLPAKEGVKVKNIVMGFFYN